MPHWCPLASATGGSALLDWGLHLPCCPPGSWDLSLQDANNSFAPHADSQTCRLRLWAQVCYPPLIALCVCVCVCAHVIILRLLESEPTFSKSWVKSLVTVCDSCLFLCAGLLNRQLAKQLPGWLIGKTVSRTYAHDRVSAQRPWFTKSWRQAL